MKKNKSISWWLVVAFWLVLLALLCTVGCGVWVEIETNPETGEITVLYENRRPFAPENAMVRTPDGWEIIMGEQPTQAAFYEKVFKAGMVYGGLLPVE